MPAYTRYGTVQRDPIYRRRFFSFLYGMEAAKDGLPITAIPPRVHNGRFRVDVQDWEHGWRSWKIAPAQST